MASLLEYAVGHIIGVVGVCGADRLVAGSQHDQQKYQEKHLLHGCKVTMISTVMVNYLQI